MWHRTLSVIQGTWVRILTPQKYLSQSWVAAPECRSGDHGFESRRVVGFFLFFSHSYHSLSQSISQIPYRGATQLVFLLKWLLSFAAWEKASLICKKNNKRCINMIIQSCSCCIAKIDWLLWRSWIRIPLRNGLFSFLYLYFSLSCASFNRS